MAQLIGGKYAVGEALSSGALSAHVSGYRMAPQTETGENPGIGSRTEQTRGAARRITHESSTVG
jgi:hypothetical protein